MPLRRALLPALLLSLLAGSANAVGPANPANPANPAAAGPADASGSVDFDASFFPAGTAPKVDLSRFGKSNVVLPGTYRGDMFLNRVWKARTDLVFVAVPGNDNAQPCFDATTLTSVGVDLKKVFNQTENLALKKIPEGRFCGVIGDYIPGATDDFDSGTQELSLFVPQIYTNQAARGYVDPSQWDPGINAAVLGYSSNFYRSRFGSQDQTSGYVGLNASLKLGSWHAYSLGSLSWSSQNGKRYQNTATYVQHDIPALQAQLVVGDTFTPGDVFDSIRLRGARLYTDDRMLPQSLRGYAPVVRGIAETNAHVIVRQHGYIIYDANVVPGAFAIDDLFPTGYGGDLDVEVVEADGRVQRFTVPFSAVAQLLRPGQSRWSVAGGKVEQLNLRNTPTVVQGTYQRGISNSVTAYGGATFASSYGAFLAGAALNTGIGAFSADLTQAQNQAPGQGTTKGLSLRVGYNKNIIDTGTNFAVAAYRYSTDGYVGLNDAIAMRDAAARGLGAGFILRQRSRMDVNINQTLGKGYGQVFLQGSVMDYWTGTGRQTNFSAGYSNHWKSFNYSFTAQRQLVSASQLGVPGSLQLDQIPGAPSAFNPQSPGRRDTLLLATVSVPLGQSAHAPQLTAMVNSSKDGGSSRQATLSGSAGADNRFNYGATAGQTDAGGSTGGLSAQYSGPLAQLSSGYSQGSGYKQLNAGASGSVVLHSGGVTFSPPTGETIGLVHAPDAAGATVSNGQGAAVNGHGYAVVPNLMPYQLNTVTLDPKGSDAGVELKSTTANVAPRAGSVVRLNYETSSGRALMIVTTLPDGRPVPFGADVFDAQGNNVGVAGQGSRLFIRDMPSSGTLTVKWGDGAANACHINVQLPPATKGRRVDLQTIRGACQADGAAATGKPAAANAEPLSMRAPSLNNADRDVADPRFAGTLPAAYVDPIVSQKAARAEA